MRDILFTGSGRSGSWQIRGHQIGTALGARVTPVADRGVIDRSSVVVAVKRLPRELQRSLRSTQTPWVWDLVDFYPQPECTSWGRSHAYRWVRQQIKSMKPDGIIWPNKQMQTDCDVAIPSRVIYHHGNPKLSLNPVRTEVKTVGYQGSPKFLGAWEKVFKTVCRNRGWRFVANEGQLSDWDIVVAFRDAPVNGYCQRFWKSNVKLANAHITGTPFLGNDEASYRETGTGDELLIRNPSEVELAFDRLAPYATRKRIHQRFVAASIRLETVVREYEEFLGEFI